MADGNDGATTSQAETLAEKSQGSSLAAKTVLNGLAKLERGEIEVRHSDGTVLLGQFSAEYPLLWRHSQPSHATAPRSRRSRS